LFPRFRSWKGLYTAFVEAGVMSAKIIIIVAIIGLIIGLMSYSGFTTRLAQELTAIADGPLFVVMVVIALGAIVLGMGLPPGATYFIIVIALSSGIDAVSVPPLSLHLFVVFFAVMSTVTPPVALAAFAAAPIAKADPIRTGWQASRLSIAGFLIPFVFIYHPAVLYKLQSVFVWLGDKPIKHKAMVDLSTVSWIDYGWIVLAFTVSIWLISSALIGFERNKLFTPERLARVVVGLALLVPSYWICLPAFAIAVALIIGHRFLGGTPPNFDNLEVSRSV
ncbi:MAG: TRAP transporter large permease subunit, partial [Alphaproteobacteria bacterium]